MDSEGGAGTALSDHKLYKMLTINLGGKAYIRDNYDKTL